MLLILMACMFYKAVFIPLGELQKLDARNLEVEGLKTQR